MTKKNPLYVIIYNNGRADNVKDGLSYYDILQEVYYKWVSCSSNRPEMLFRDGKIIVKSGLSDIAYKHWNWCRVAQEKLAADMRAEFPEPNGDFEENVR